MERQAFDSLVSKSNARVRVPARCYGSNHAISVPTSSFNTSRAPCKASQLKLALCILRTSDRSCLFTVPTVRNDESGKSTSSASITTCLLLGTSTSRLQDVYLWPPVPGFGHQRSATRWLDLFCQYRNAVVQDTYALFTKIKLYQTCLNERAKT